MADKTQINLNLNELNECLCSECKVKFQALVGKAVLANKQGGD